MCLSLTVSVPVSAQPALEAAVAALPGDSLPVSTLWRMPLLERRVRATIARTAGDCGCSLLSDAADWNAAAWDFVSEVREPLARTLEHLANARLPDFWFEALWAGDSPSERRVMTPLTLAALARGNQISTCTRYVVPSPPAA
jgi:hypothetical protein